MCDKWQRQGQNVIQSCDFVSVRAGGLADLRRSLEEGMASKSSLTELLAEQQHLQVTAAILTCPVVLQTRSFCQKPAILHKNKVR